MGRGWFGKQVLDQSGDFVFEGGVAFGIGGAGESGVDFFDAAVATEEEGGGPAVETDSLGDFFVELVGLAGYQDGVGDAVAGDEGAEAGGVFELIGLFKGEVDDLEASGVVLLVEGLEEGSFVVAVGAPGAADGDDDDLAVEAGVAVGYERSEEHTSELQSQ